MTYHTLHSIIQVSRIIDNKGGLPPQLQGDLLTSSSSGLLQNLPNLWEEGRGGERRGEVKEGNNKVSHCTLLRLQCKGSSTTWGFKQWTGGDHVLHYLNKFFGNTEIYKEGWRRDPSSIYAYITSDKMITWVDQMNTTSSTSGWVARLRPNAQLPVTIGVGTGGLGGLQPPQYSWKGGLAPFISRLVLLQYRLSKLN